MPAVIGGNPSDAPVLLPPYPNENARQDGGMARLHMERARDHKQQSFPNGPLNNTPHFPLRLDMEAEKGQLLRREGSPNRQASFRPTKNTKLAEL